MESLCRAKGCASPGDGALGGAERGGDVANGCAAGAEAGDDLLLFDCGEVVVGEWCEAQVAGVGHAVPSTVSRRSSSGGVVCVVRRGTMRHLLIRYCRPSPFPTDGANALERC